MLHQELISKLEKEILEEKEKHLYLFTGEDGIGKKTLAKHFAKMLMCHGKGKVPCQICRSCKLFEAGTNVDFFELEKDGNHIPVAKTRELQPFFGLKPINGNRKVVLIIEAENMTTQAQNSILKLFEEPPPYATIIMTSIDKNQLLDTIRSRTYVYRLKKQSKDEIENELNLENIYPSKMQLSYGGGNIGKTKYAMSEEFLEDCKMAYDLIKKKLLDERGRIDADLIINRMEPLLEMMAEMCRDLLIMKYGEKRIIYSEYKQEYIKLLTHISEDEIHDAYNAVNRALSLFSLNTNKKIVLDHLMI